MSAYEIQEDWPNELKDAAEAVMRADLLRERRRKIVIGCEEDRRVQYCLDRYIEADRHLRNTKARFDDLYYCYTRSGGNLLEFEALKRG